MCKIVKGQKYFWNDEFYRWEGLKENATQISYGRCNVLKAEFPIDTYFIKWKDG